MTSRGELVRRRGRPDDYPVFARLFREIESEHPVPSADTWQRELARQSILLELDGVVIAFAESEVFHDRAHVHLVAVAPEQRRRGVGRSLMEAVIDDLAKAGVPRFFLHVRAENTAAIALYEAIGMSRVGSSVGLCIGWSQVRALPASEARAVELDDGARDAAFERAFGLSNRRIERERARGSVVIGLERAGAAVGLAVKNRELAQASPLRVLAPDLARPLLLALEPHLGGDEVALALTDDAATESLLRKAGARVMHRAHRYERAL